MSENPPIQSTIESYRKRRNRFLPFILWGVAAVLILGGIIILVLSLKGGGKLSLFATKTPTPTLTFTPTNTVPPTATATLTSTPTLTLTPTPSAPFYYIIQEGDSISIIAEKYGLGDNGVIQILLMNPSIDPLTQVIFAGQEILVPPPGWPMPTLTPWPADASRGTKIKYFVMAGDSLGTIAEKFNSTPEDIVKANPDILKDVTTLIYPGQTLVVPVNMVTPVPTRTATIAPTATP